MYGGHSCNGEVLIQAFRFSLVNYHSHTIIIYTESSVYSTTLTCRPRKSKNRNSTLYSTANYRNSRYTARNGGVFISGLDRYQRSTLCSLKLLTTPQYEPQKIKEQLADVTSHIISYLMNWASLLGSLASHSNFFPPMPHMSLWTSWSSLLSMAEV